MSPPSLRVLRVAPRVAFALAAALLATPSWLGCSRSSTAHASPDEDARAPVPRYWLRNASVLQTPGGKEIRYVRGPAEVELLPDGRVRSTPDATDRFEGYLPDGILKEAKSDQGLMLYAQRTGDLHFKTPAGPVIGRLHPGAFVSVVPGDKVRVAVGSLGFAKYGPLTAYVDWDVLGVEPRTPSVPIAPGGVRALVSPADFGFMDPTTGEQAAVAADSCRDLWYAPNGVASQTIAGVELAGQANVRTNGPRTYISTVLCPGAAVSQHGSRLFLTQPLAGELEIDRIPDGDVHVEIPKPDPLAGCMSKGQSVYWLMYDDTQPYCGEWQFEEVSAEARPTRVVAKGRLRNRVRPNNRPGTEPAWYPVEYQLSDGTTPARLHLDCGQPCEGNHFEYSYSLLGLQGNALLVIPYRIPEKTVAYDPGEAERWFVSRSACESALAQVVETIRSNPALATRMGFHIRED